MWCLIPTKIRKLVIYRHKHWDTLYIVGLEFFKSKNQENANTLLGFRSLWTEHAIVLEIEDEEKILGVAAQSNESRDGIPVLSAPQVGSLLLKSYRRGDGLSLTVLTI